MLIRHRLALGQNVVAAFLAATLYGLAADVLFQMRPEDWWRTLSIGFLLVMPFAVGAITLALSPPKQRSSWSYAVFAPWVPCTVIGIVAILLAMELMVCVVMALPMFCLMSSLGGLAVTWRHRRAISKHGTGSGQAYGFVALLIIAPAVISPLEQRFPGIEQEYRVVESVKVAATPETIWHEIVAVDMIQPHEQHWSWFQALGLPQPHEATLHQAGLKRVRTASYSNGIRVREPIEVWEPYTRVGFTVELAQVPTHQSLWGMVDGQYLDVTYVEFVIKDDAEGAAQGMTHLQLVTVYRLSTPVNGYARAWIDFLLSDFQRYILNIVSSRASLAASAM